MRKWLVKDVGLGLFAWVTLALLPLSFCRADANKALIDAGKKATAYVEISQGATLTGSASAFCIDRSGIFVTNNHVAKTGAKDNKLTLVIDSGLSTQRTVKATILKTDPETDLAVLRADHAGPYESLELGDAASIRGLAETAQVAVFGYPLGDSLALGKARPEASISLSRITALRQDRGELQLIQLDGSINPGNSGGPVLDERGKVVGIISAGIEGAAISFAIPANRVGRLLLAAQVTLRGGSPADGGAAFDAVLANPTADDPAGRASVPDDAARKDARKIIHELLAKEFADTTPKGKKTLAAALLSRGQATTDDPAGGYELLSQACDAAVDAGDLETAIASVGELGRRYDINTTAQKAGILTRLAPKVTLPVDQSLLAAHGLLVAQSMVRRDMCADARKLIPVVRAAATASYNARVQSQVSDKLAVVEAACARYALAQPAMETLKATPDDPEANLAVGRYECFVRGDFDKGLPLLAKGADEALKAAASADLGKPSTAPACKTAGDAWWDLAARETKDAAAAEQCKARAGVWYRLAENQLGGLARTVVQKRLALLPAPASPAVQSAAASVAPASGDADASKLVSVIDPSSKYEVDVVRIGTQFKHGKDYALSEVPKELIGAAILRGPDVHWLPPDQVAVSKECDVYAGIRYGYKGQIQFSEAQFDQLTQEGWEVLKDEPFVTTTYKTEDWKWQLVRKHIPAGKVDLTTALHVPVAIFMFEPASAGARSGTATPPPRD